MDSDRPIADLEAQLRSLYTERAILFAELGTADARAVVAMIRSLEAQLADLYGERVASRPATGVDEPRTHRAPRTKE